MSNETKPDHLVLKWGALKGWNFNSERGKELLQKYFDLGSSGSAMTQEDTHEQKTLICDIIEECDAPTIHLDWDGKDVSKDEAKRYVMEYSA